MVKNLVDDLSYEGTKAMIKEHEGLRTVPYKDSVGKATIGYGHLIKPQENFTVLSSQDAENLLDADIADAELEVDKLGSSITGGLSATRKAVLIDMMFNLGPSELKKFKKMLDAIKKRDFNKASDEMAKSKWKKQVGSRATRLIKMMKTGNWTSK